LSPNWVAYLSRAASVEMFTDRVHEITGRQKKAITKMRSLIILVFYGLGLD